MVFNFFSQVGNTTKNMIIRSCSPLSLLLYLFPILFHHTMASSLKSVLKLTLRLLPLILSQTTKCILPPRTKATQPATKRSKVMDGLFQGDETTDHRRYRRFESSTKDARRFKHQEVDVTNICELLFCESTILVLGPRRCRATENVLLWNQQFE